MAETAPGFPKVKGETRPWVCKSGNASCTRSAPCWPCKGRRNRRKGQEKQRAAARALHIPPSKFASQMGHEENLRGPFRIEVKAGAQVKAVATKFLAAERQSEAARAVGDNRPFMFVAMPDGMSDGLAVVRLSQLDRVVEAAYNA